jgi:3-methyl-2-oxobutanoate hydroxymethyltransferase
MEDMLHHCRAVARGTQRALVVGDMPFLSYQVSVSEAVRNAGLFLKEGNVDAVKLEGGRERLDAINAILAAGIPVMGHIGLTPQSVHQFGGFFVQGKTAKEGHRLLQDARALAKAGCFSLVLESIPSALAEFITRDIDIPTIGIGAGAGCDGQVLVTQDMLGMFDQFQPKFVKIFRDLKPEICEAIDDYKQEVIENSFPTDEHSFHMPKEEWERFLKMAEGTGA